SALSCAGAARRSIDDAPVAHAAYERDAGAGDSARADRAVRRRARVRRDARRDVEPDRQRRAAGLGAAEPRPDHHARNAPPREPAPARSRAPRAVPADHRAHRGRCAEARSQVRRGIGRSRARGRMARARRGARSGPAMIVGTAGHIDHGKTTLVRALSGVDTDRLAEEKARGMTIELGYAYVPIGDGRVLGFVDVPGHERLVRTMVAGACGIDFALLVVAADDGVMPQTVEHLAILGLLGVERGAVAL